jgi:hypothetical protein
MRFSRGDVQCRAEIEFGGQIQGFSSTRSGVFGREAGRFRDLPGRRPGSAAAGDPLLRIPCFAES